MSFASRLRPPAALLLLALSVGAGAGTPRAPASLEVRYEDARLWVRAHDTPLDEVLGAVAGAAGFELILRADLSEPVSEQLEGVPLSSGLRHLTRHWSSLVQVGEGAAADDLPRKVWILGPAALEAQGPDAFREPGARAVDTVAAPASLVAQLDHRDAELRIAALQQLDADAAAILVDQLALLLKEDRDPGVRRAALQRLAELPRTVSFDAIGAGLGDAQPGIRQETMTALVRLDDEAALPLLGQVLLSDPDPETRMAAVRLVRRIPGPASTSLLGAARSDQDRRIRSLAQENVTHFESDAVNGRDAADHPAFR